jgi:hypothetical protein
MRNPANNLFRPLAEEKSSRRYRVWPKIPQASATKLRSVPEIVRRQWRKAKDRGKSLWPAVRFRKDILNGCNLGMKGIDRCFREAQAPAYCQLRKSISITKAEERGLVHDGVPPLP